MFPIKGGGRGGGGRFEGRGGWEKRGKEVVVMENCGDCVKVVFENKGVIIVEVGCV